MLIQDLAKKQNNSKKNKVSSDTIKQTNENIAVVGNKIKLPKRGLFALPKVVN